jgi:hypothetical protein
MKDKSPPAAGSFVPPHPGSPLMPRWESGELIDAPRFTWRNWIGLLGPGLVMGGAAIGGGEWLTGPLVTARYGGALFWLATLSIVGQVFYNIEISRYTLYCGEPIFVGKFRTPPAPLFWLGVYLALDFGAVFPYLAASAAAPVAGMWLGYMPNPDTNPDDKALILNLAFVIFILFLMPLFVGGKVYTSLKWLMSTKIVVVLGFLLVIAVLYSSAATWHSIGTGFLRFGTVPIRTAEDRNGNGVLDAGEDWDGDGRLDVVEERRDTDGDGKPDKLDDRDGDGIRDGDNVDNVFVAWWEGRSLPPIDFTMIATLTAMVAIAGNGGLTNTSISAYTRDQGWGMGHHVGAIPSVIGGHKIELSHVGKVFEVTPETLPRWRRWVRHLARDQIAVWMPACFVGLALPSMLSVEFLQRGVEGSKWTVAGLTAGAVQERVTEVSGMAWWGTVCWYMVLLCGLLVLAPSATSAADGFIRRWIDVFWTGSARMRQVNPRRIRELYFGVLTAYAAFGAAMLWFVEEPIKLLEIVGVIYNYALGFSCWHTLVVNTLLLPRELRPGWFARVGLFLSGLFFIAIAGVATYITAIKYMAA